ncbi:MAG TPA: alpha/beta hydrolase-fold protein [Gemmatimonadaceae bacterium]|nr:alpha/beta hydrolase-fold protein [Gemmatimonadaceae bacterium]
MTKRLAALALFTVATRLDAQLTIRVRQLPADTPAGATIYAAGSFNGWNPAAPGFALARGSDGTYSVTLPDSIRGHLEFKLTRGSWETVEVSATGGDMANRSVELAPGAASTLEVSVGGWRDAIPREPPKHTASRSVSIVSDSFAIPQLGRTRRVWVYLPPDYATSTRRYRVLYMHDGQNAFDAATSFAGEWGVDETLDSLFARGDSGTIVVGIDHGANHRLDEYDPWRATNPRYGGGEGEAYTRFLVETLKPWIDARYRTIPDRAHTAIAGSSMGGLISLYAALTRPEVFGRAGIFSCACWIARDSVYALVRRARPRAGATPRLYFVVGGEETADDEPVRDQDAIVKMLRDGGWPADSLRALVVEDGKHAEWFWRREFPAAYQWLYGAPRH